MALFLFACEQAPIFDMISREVKPREPRVKGVPTKMVLYEYETSKYGMYVADSSLHRYAAEVPNGEGVWDKGSIPQPSGRIFDLAATKSYLYALTDPDSPRLYRFDWKEMKWTEVKFVSDNQGYSRLQTIYGECGSDGKPLTDSLYLGASNSAGAYAVFHTDGITGLTLIPSTTGLLTGAAYDGSDKHYFATDGGGVYTSTNPDTLGFSLVPETEGAIKGLIQLPFPSSSVIALRGDGALIELNSGSVKKVYEAADNSLSLTGPAAVWKDNGGNTLLLLAVRVSLSGSNSTYGYRELDITSGFPTGDITLKEPGSDPAHSTADDNKRYKDTIEPKPVNSLLQVPSDRTLFASVQGRGISQNNTDGGLWSYRSRDGIWQWNAEE
ncbi:MAG: hypothetical protein LBI94_06690 [Treponema sp.]|jgi:hypothetical protein|nr:hypothetical protein [Treponema sp.]